MLMSTTTHIMVLTVNCLLLVAVGSCCLCQLWAAVQFVKFCRRRRRATFFSRFTSFWGKHFRFTVSRLTDISLQKKASLTSLQNEQTNKIKIQVRQWTTKPSDYQKLFFSETGIIFFHVFVFVTFSLVKHFAVFALVLILSDVDTKLK